LSDEILTDDDQASFDENLKFILNYARVFTKIGTFNFVYL